MDLCIDSYALEKSVQIYLIGKRFYSLETSKCRLNSDKASTAANKGAEAWKKIFGETLTISDDYIKEVIPISKLTNHFKV